LIRMQLAHFQLLARMGHAAMAMDGCAPTRVDQNVWMLLSWKFPQKHKGGMMYAEDPRMPNRRENEPHAMDAFVKAGIERRTSEISNNCRQHLKLLTTGNMTMVNGKQVVEAMMELIREQIVDAEWPEQKDLPADCWKMWEKHVKGCMLSR